MTLLRERTPLHEAPVIATPPSPDGAARSAAPSWIRPGRTLMVASTGGHLEQLYRLRQRFMPELVALSDHLGRDLVTEWGYDDVR